jgi:predicted transcriptional regulator
MAKPNRVYTSFSLEPDVSDYLNDLAERMGMPKSWVVNTIIYEYAKVAPRHAEQVRNVIANAWIDATHAQFDVATLPESAVSRDLFRDRVLVER